ncbi:sodium:proton antiporter [Mycolicibacterium chitae]|uniref:Ion antiporter, NhaP n=1 Tax=Mycolicibacterium chitae TaxID=1792 RepID=A0A3S4VFE6_MYCCI|nr:cation:proton antiporter [Mycolicibacterium chitae]MCV7105692.1 cation:proton antiporter [Mycolicibacterium chitae]BBZ03094.1 sodium:proton antiporter [Mycolicibacterium chitae]VEG46294.1 ion antiporter, NhaP [Mycolicibacterium chitae]
MHSTIAITLTVMVFGYAVMSAIVHRWYVAPALIFVAAGMLLGPSGLGVLPESEDADTFTVLAQLALTVILFNHAVAVVTGGLRGRITGRLLLIGIPLTLILGTVTALLLLPVLPLWEAVCLAAILAPTEVALIEALLEDRRIPEQVRHALSVESGLYDGFALATLLAAIAVASGSAEDESATAWVLFAVRTELLSVAVGAGVGLLGSMVIVYSVRRHWMSKTWAQLATLAVALLCFQVGETLHASGFVAAFVGGLVYAVVSRRAGQVLPTQVTDATGKLLELLVFALFGAYLLVSGWRDATWQVVLFAVLALVVVRMAAVAAALWGTEAPLRSRLFIGWFGPRGIGSLVLAMIVLGRGELEHSDLLVQVTVVAVSISLVLSSVTVPCGIRLVSVDRLVRSGP